MEPRSGDRLRILTWHVHGSYLPYLAHALHRGRTKVPKSGRMLRVNDQDFGGSRLLRSGRRGIIRRIEAAADLEAK